MSWYYAGPESKPVGPLSVEELHARHVSGIVTPQTFIIEHTGQPIENWVWKHYHEVFPTNLSPVPPLPAILPAPPSAQPQATSPHPLFPSAAPVSNQHPVFPSAARPDPYYTNAKPTNGWCAWGFGLGLASLIFSFACGIGLLLALPSLLLCITGLVQVQKNREQSGHGLAIAGLALSGLALVISLILIISLAIPMLKAHGLTVTEQTSNDSE